MNCFIAAKRHHIICSKDNIRFIFFTKSLEQARSPLSIVKFPLPANSSLHLFYILNRHLKTLSFSEKHHCYLAVRICEQFFVSLLHQKFHHPKCRLIVIYCNYIKISNVIISADHTNGTLPLLALFNIAIYKRYK